MASPVSVPNSFTAATDAVAAEVNANFDAVVDYINDNMVHDDGTTAIGGTQTVNNLIVQGTLTTQGNLAAAGTLNGDIVASNGSDIVLNNGTNGTDAWFKGDIHDSSGTTILDVSVPALKGDVQDSSGTTIVDVSVAEFKGKADTAVKWHNSMQLSLTGAVTSSIYSIDGSQNVAINTTIGSVPASSVTSGTFNGGNYTFPSNVYCGDVFTSELMVGQSSLQSLRKFYVAGGGLGSEVNRNTSSGSEGIFVISGLSGSSKFIFYGDGTAAKSTGAGDWAGISDDRLKTKGDSIDPDATLAAMMTLDPTWHQYHTDANFTGDLDENGFEGVELISRDEPTAPTMGFMASDLEAAFPNLITYKGAENIRLVPTGQYDALLTASIISLGRKIEELNTRLEAVEAA